MFKNWKFKGQFKYKFKFRISFPVKGGYAETNLIDVNITANSKKEAKEKINKIVKEKVKVTIIECYEQNC